MCLSSNSCAIHESRYHPPAKLWQALCFRGRDFSSSQHFRSGMEKKTCLWGLYIMLGSQPKKAKGRINTTTVSSSIMGSVLENNVQTGAHSWERSITRTTGCRTKMDYQILIIIPHNHTRNRNRGSMRRNSGRKTQEGTN